MLSADDIKPRHCVVHCSDDTVKLTKQDGDCYVNREEVSDPKQLLHGTCPTMFDQMLIPYTFLCCAGDIVQFGQATVFRFNNVSQAAEVEDVS